MAAMAKITPTKREANSMEGFGRRREYSAMVRNNTGKKTSFRCSQTDSFTGTIRARKGL
ncbi:hypothetical protein [Claveliimonas sp.]|uniref:hypothetical protein n=1 Tax=Claveliimonas sp. TaxID=3076672 RepID=UPI00307BF4AC